MSPTDGLGTLIAAPMPGVDVSLFDGQLRPLEPTLRDNEFSWRVPAGLYKIRYQAGSSIHEELVALDDVTTPQRLPQPRLEVTSAAPLRNTSSTHQYHEGPAAADSRGAPDALGQGARLFALVRSRGGAFKRPEPLRGLTLVREGRTVLRFDQARRGGNDTCATFHIEVDPGPYTLRYAMTDVTLEQTLFLADRWQTQLFISEAPDDEPAALDMPGLGVLMARIGAGFDPRRPDLQITELARKALRRGQSTLGSEQIRYLLREKFENPMLGVLVAHLLLAHHERGGLLDEVLDNTADLIPGHPDVDCLLSATERRVPAALACPPMLTRSWQLLVRGDGQAAMGIATEDHLADMALSQWDTGGTWLTWSHEEKSSWGSIATSLGADQYLRSIVGNVLPDVRGILTDARALLRAVANGTVPLVDRGVLEAAAPLLADGRDHVSRYIQRTFGFSEAETAFVLTLLMSYLRSGAEAVTPPALAARLHVPPALVPVLARRLADRLGNRDEPPRRNDRGLSAGAS